MYAVTQIGVQARQTYGDKPSSRHVMVMALYYMLPERFTKDQALHIIRMVKEYQPALARLDAAYYWKHLLEKQYLIEVS